MSAKISVDDLAKLYVLVDKMPDKYLDLLVQRCQARHAVLEARRLAKAEAKMNDEDEANHIHLRNPMGDVEVRAGDTKNKTSTLNMTDLAKSVAGLRVE